jgi:cyclophilin family peptidyl-prolyl cis-trans isomerase
VIFSCCRYGVGPYFVEFQLQEQAHHQAKPLAAFFTVELASMELMPATVYSFLEQVDRGLWDSASFHFYEQANVLTEQSVSNDVSRPHQAFQESGFAAPTPVFLDERNDSFQNIPYTLTFTGESSPLFTVNKMANGSTNGDSIVCGHVVIGRDVVDRFIANDDVQVIRMVAARRAAYDKFSHRATVEYQKNAQ